MTFVKHDDLFIKCNGCNYTQLIYEGQTDHLLKNDWVKENGWKTIFVDSKFIDLCPDCYCEYRKEIRTRKIKEFAK